MTAPDPTAVSDLVVDLRERLLEMSKRPTPAMPPKKLLADVEPSIRDDVLATAADVRAEHILRKAVSRSLAKQARALERTMTADATRLLEVAQGITGARPKDRGA